MMLDKDLEFLKNVDDKYLGVLVDVMINYDGGTSNIKAVKEECSKYGASYQNYLDVIVDAYLNYGKDVLKSIGKGDFKISYRHVLSECCQSVNVDFNAQLSVKTIENNLLKSCLKLEKDCQFSADELVEIVVKTYSKPKSTSWAVWVTLPIMATIPTLVAPLFMPWWLSVFGMAKEVYQKCRPEFQVILPCTLLIALYRKMFG